MTKKNLTVFFSTSSNIIYALEARTSQEIATIVCANFGVIQPAL